MNEQELEALIASAVNCQHVEIVSEGNHFQLIAVSPEFSGASRVLRQQKIYNVLKPYIEDGSIHAVTMKTYAPEEWEQLNNG